MKRFGLDLHISLKVALLISPRASLVDLQIMKVHRGGPARRTCSPLTLLWTQSEFLNHAALGVSERVHHNECA
jgi:hypothetical protein